MSQSTLNRVFSAIIDNLIWVFVVIAFIAFSILSDAFLTPFSIGNILLRIATLGLLVLSQSYTFITGNFDLSVESTLAFVAMVAGLLLVSDVAGGLGIMLPIYIVIPIMLVIGALIGLFNGFLITKIGVNNLIVTIAMLFILRGATYGISPGTSISFGGEEFAAFTWLGSGTLARFSFENVRGNLVIPVAGVFVILAFIIAYIHTRYTQFGRNMYAIGADAEVARASGINVDRTLIIVYMIAGVCAALAGLISAGRLQTATPTMGDGVIFSVHAAAIIGGMSIYGGRGNVLGAFGGVLLWSILDNGLNIMGVSPFWIEVSRGGLLLFAIAIDALRVRYQRRVALRQSLAESSIGLQDARAGA
jgi:ribose/xylose/arabinose/galactoside ABC-type transport system permease subunit